MCKCTPNLRAPFCGKPGCEWPEQVRVRAEAAMLAEAHKKVTNAANLGQPEDFRMIEDHKPTNDCPVCHGKTSLWQRRRAGTDIWDSAVMCESLDEEEFGECPLYLAPEGFYCETKRQAIELWNRRTAPRVSPASSMPRLEFGPFCGCCTRNKITLGLDPSTEFSPVGSATAETTGYWRCPCCQNYYTSERLVCPVSGDSRPAQEATAPIPPPCAHCEEPELHREAAEKAAKRIRRCALCDAPIFSQHATCEDCIRSGKLL